MKKLFLAAVATGALALASAPAMAETSKVFGNTGAKVLSPDANKKVVGKGTYGQYYGYYGQLYAYYAYYYGYYGYYYGSTSLYYNAYYYSYYATQYLYTAYYYSYYGV